MELHQFLEKGILLVSQQIVKANTASHKDLLHPRDFSQLSQQGNIVAVIGTHILAGGGVEALPSSASTLGQLLFAGGVAEVGGGTAYVMDVALEIRVFGHQLCFRENGFVTPGLDDAPLVEVQRAERALPQHLMSRELKEGEIPQNVTVHMLFLFGRSASRDIYCKGP